MGTLITLDVPEGSETLAMPWIITFGSASADDVWEQVVCGPYERAHALALAESVIADDEDLLAFVEPLQPAVTADQIRGEIAAARLAAEEAEDDETEDHSGCDHDHGEEEDEVATVLGAPPTPEEIRAGFARIAAHLA